jgi:ADP-ribose pyrophosphatase
MDFYEKTEKESIIYQGKIIKVKELDIKLPNGLMGKREIVEHPGAVAILTTTKDGKIVLIKQFRKACEEILWEIPAGKLEKGEAPLDCAKRELKEETGYTARNWALLGKFYTSPGFCNELIYTSLNNNKYPSIYFQLIQLLFLVIVYLSLLIFHRLFFPYKAH